MRIKNGYVVAVGIVLALGAGACGGVGDTQSAESVRTATEPSVAGLSGSILELMQRKSQVEDQIALLTQSIQTLTTQAAQLTLQGQPVGKIVTTIAGLEAQERSLQDQLAIINQEISVEQAQNRQNDNNYYGNPFGSQ